MVEDPPRDAVCDEVVIRAGRKLATMLFSLGITLLITGTGTLVAGIWLVQQAEDKRQLLGFGILGVFIGGLMIWWGVYCRYFSGPEVILAKEGLKLPPGGTGIIPWVCIERATVLKGPTTYVCLSLKAGMNTEFKEHRIERGFRAFFRLISGFPCDVLIADDLLQWPAERLAGEINRRKDQANAEQGAAADRPRE